MVKQVFKKPNTHQTTQKTTHTGVHLPLPASLPLSSGEPVLDQDMCLCDGLCPRCKSQDESYQVVKEDDQLEKEADQVAAQVVSTPTQPQETTKQETNTPSESKTQTPAKPTRQSNSNVITKTVAGAPSRENQETEIEEENEELEKREKTFPVGATSNQGSSINLRQSGEPLSIFARNYFEPRFGQDLNHVRIHYNEEAAHYSDHLNAKAFTLGNHIYFGKNQYQPETITGKKLMAHELTHVVQQTQNKSNPCIQRTTDEQRQREQLLDLTDARILETFYGRLDPNPHILIQHAAELHQDFTRLNNRPITLGTIARILLRIYRVLLERAASAERDPNGVLLRPDLRGMVPWAANNPTRVEDIAPFSDENVAAWQEVIEQEMLRQIGTNIPNVPPPPSQARPQQVASRAQSPTEEVQENEEQDPEPETQEQTTSVQIRTGLREQPNSYSEQLTGSQTAGGTEIQNGITQLQSTRLGAANQAIVQSIPENFRQNAQMISEIAPDTSLLSVTGLVFYISGRRCYILDRSGHISGDTFYFDLEWTRDLRPGTYFLANYSAGSSSIRILSRINGANGVSVAWTHSGTPAEGDVSAGESTLDIRVRNRREFDNVISSVLGRNGGIGVIVSQHAQRPLDLPTSLLGVNLSRVREAWGHAFDRDLMYWALRTKLNDVWTNIWSELGQAVRDAVIEAIIHRIPGGNGYMLMFQGLQLTAWLGRVTSIAGFGTRDEMRIASQYIARSVVNFCIDEFLLEGSISVVGQVGSRSLRINTDTNYRRMERAMEENRTVLGDDRPGGRWSDIIGVYEPETETPEGFIPEPNQEISESSYPAPTPLPRLPSVRPQQAARANRETQDTPSPDTPSPMDSANTEARIAEEEEVMDEHSSTPGTAQPSSTPSLENPPVSSRAAEESDNPDLDAEPSATPTSENQEFRGLGYAGGRLRYSGESDAFMGSWRGRAFYHRPPTDPHADPLDPARMQIHAPSGGRRNPAEERENADQIEPEPPQRRSANRPSPQRHLPGTLTPEMLSHPSIGTPPIGSNLAAPTPDAPETSTPQLELVEPSPNATITPSEAAEENNLFPPLSTFEEQELSPPALDHIRHIFNVARILNDDGTPLQGQTRSRERMIEYFTALSDLRDTIPPNLRDYEIRIIREALELADQRLEIEQDISDSARTRGQELAELERSHREDSQNPPDREFSQTAAYTTWNERWRSRGIQLSRALQQIDQHIDNLADRAILSWLNRPRHSRRFREGSRAVMEASAAHAGDVVDTDADVNDWSTTTQFDTDPDSDYFVNMHLPPASNNELIDSNIIRRPTEDEHGNLWFPMEGTDNWRVNLSVSGHRHITRELLVNLTHYLRIDTRFQALIDRSRNTLEGRISGSYVIVDNQGHLVPRNPPPFPRYAENIEFVVTQVRAQDEECPIRENIDWIFVPALNLWALRDRTAPEGEVLEYVTPDGEMIQPDREEE
ncbi:DUF4157 domain-containing protein [bacterium]|nr:DUF4157 domain-containing protein [bacterium]